MRNVNMTIKTVYRVPFLHKLDFYDMQPMLQLAILTKEPKLNFIEKHF